MEEPFLSTIEIQVVLYRVRIELCQDNVPKANARLHACCFSCIKTQCKAYSTTATINTNSIIVQSVPKKSKGLRKDVPCHIFKVIKLHLIKLNLYKYYHH